MTNITFIGAGSVRYTLKLIHDIAITKRLKDSKVTLMDIDETRLDAVNNLAKRLTAELGGSLEFEKSTDLKGSIKNSDIVINTALARAEGHEDGYVQYEKMRTVANKHGYYRGVDAQDFNRVSDYFTFTNYNQLNLVLKIAQTVEQVSPDAWLLNTSNPVFEITQLVKRKTDVKILGLCHGFQGVYEVFEALKLDKHQVDWQVAGVNHGIWLNRFRYRDKNGYSLLDKWIEENFGEWTPEDHWDMQMSPAAIDMYEFYNRLPIGDTVRNGTWKYNYDLGTKKRWYGKYGGIDNNSERPKYYEELRAKKRDLIELSKNSDLSVLDELEFSESTLSGEQHIPIINGLENDVESRIFPNVRNNGVIDGIPDEVVVEIPAKVDSEGVHPVDIEPPIPSRIKKMYIRPRILRMEWALEAFNSGDRDVLEEVLIRDPRTKSYEQVQNVWEDILNLPFNKEMKKHYS